MLLPVLRFQCKTGTRFSLRDKWLFETSQVEITRVDSRCDARQVQCRSQLYKEALLQMTAVCSIQLQQTIYICLQAHIVSIFSLKQKFL